MEATAYLMNGDNQLCMRLRQREERKGGRVMFSRAREAQVSVKKILTELKEGLKNIYIFFLLPKWVTT